jgi:hypothetical protein
MYREADTERSDKRLFALSRRTVRFDIWAIKRPSGVTAECPSTNYGPYCTLDVLSPITHNSLDALTEKKSRPG